MLSIRFIYCCFSSEYVGTASLFFQQFSTVGKFAGFIACSKNASDWETSNDQQLYIRIAQVDIDGTTSYSKAVQVTKK